MDDLDAVLVGHSVLNSQHRRNDHLNFSTRSAISLSSISRSRGRSSRG